MSQTGLFDISDRLEQLSRKVGYEARGGQIINAGIVEVSRLRGKPDEDHEAGSRQQDKEARWTKKHVSDGGFG